MVAPATTAIEMVPACTPLTELASSPNCPLGKICTLMAPSVLFSISSRNFSKPI